jgi:hypothetical protein
LRGTMKELDPKPLGVTGDDHIHHAPRGEQPRFRRRQR